LFNPAMEKISLSPIVAISEEVNRKVSETGKEFILFQRGEIGFQTPQYIIDALEDALKQGLTKYPISGGHIKLKNAIIKKLSIFNNINSLDPDNIVVVHGGQEGLQLVFKLFEGQKAVGFAPVWSCVLENFVPYSRTDFKQIPLEKDFSINYKLLEEEITDAAFLYLNSPHNPTGKIFSKEEVEKIVEICRRYGTYILSDEAYERITFDGKKHFSPMQSDYENIIGVYTFSKTYAMTGWRLGFVCGNSKAIKAYATVKDNSDSGQFRAIQKASIVALNHLEITERTVAKYSRRFNLLVAALNEVGFNARKPKGSFYIYVKAPVGTEGGKVFNSASEFSEFLITESLISTVPWDDAGKYIRFSVTFEAGTEEKEVEVINEMKRRMKLLRLNF